MSDGRLLDRPSIRRARKSFSRAWPDYAIVGGLAIVVRLCVAAIWPAAYYFPDSWTFITASMPHWQIYPIDPPTISFLWRIGTLGFYNERNVLILQGALGVLTVLLVFACLRLIPTRTAAREWAFGLALFIAVFPAQLFVERLFMPYAAASFLVALAVWMVMRMLIADHPPERAIAFLSASVVLGLAASVWTALMLPSLLAWLLLVAAWIRLSRLESVHVVLAGSCVVAALLCLSLAPSWLATKNHSGLGVWSPQPVDGTVLFARFGPLISCHESPTFTPLVAASVQQVCGTHFAAPQKMAAEWSGALNKTMVTRSHFATTQAQLRSLATDAILAHPGAALGTVLTTFWWQLVNTPLSDLVSDTNGNRFGLEKGSTFFSYTLLHQGWFLGATSRPDQSLALRTAVSNTRSLSRLPLWGTVLVLIARLVIWWRERRRAGTRGPLGPNPRIAPLRFWTAAICGTLVVGVMCSIAVGAPPVWSYWLPVLPAWLVVFALALPGSVIDAQDLEQQVADAREEERRVDN